MRWLAVIGLALSTACASFSQSDHLPKDIGIWGVHIDSASKIRPDLPWVFEYKQPPAYMEMWKDIAACEGIQIDTTALAAVKFFAVNASHFAPTDSLGKWVAYMNGLSVADPNQIILPYIRVLDWPIIEHEMLHIELYLAKRPHKHGQPEADLMFIKCGITPTSSHTDPIRSWPKASTP
jgi:hypothetical protein